MIIRSQDKTIITTNLNIWISKEVVGYEIENNNFKLGAYTTEEKAIKVLDMIQKEYSKYIYGQGGQMATANYYVETFAFIPPKVFQMPQDSEV